MLKELKIALINSGINMTEFAKSIGRSRTTVYLVASGKTTSNYTLDKIEHFIKQHSDDTPQNVVNVPNQNEWLSTTEFSQVSGLRPESVANNCANGKYKRAKKHGKKWLIHNSELKGYL